MNTQAFISDSNTYHEFLDSIYRVEQGQQAKFSMHSSITPAILDEKEANGFINRYEIIQQYLKISEKIFKDSLFDNSHSRIRDLILNEVNPDFSVSYHRELYSKKTSTPYFFRTDESVPGKISEIQYGGSLWGMVDVLQQSLEVLSTLVDIPIRSFNQVKITEIFAEIIKDLTNNDPLIFHQIDESSNMLDMNLFISLSRKYGLKYLGRDYDVSLNNVNFIRTHSFLEEVTNSNFIGFLEKYHKGTLLFDIFPSVLFFQKLPLMLPFWEETKNYYPDSVRDIFPFSSLVGDDDVILESGAHLTIDEFVRLKAGERNYYLKYAGMNGNINWGAKSVYQLSNSSVQCKKLLQTAAEQFRRGQYWIIQKAYHKKESVSYVSEDSVVTKPMYTKYSGFYGPKGFMGGHVMTRSFYKVHGQNEGVCRLIL
ncbi:MAG: hypothetical protein V1917_03305 [Candidatus Gottesmanbacteria bacterium]